MDDLVTWLLEQVAEDERQSRAAVPGPWRYNPAKEWHAPEELAKPPYMRLPGEEFVGAGPLDATVGVAATGPADNPQSMADAAFIAAWNPARVLAECEAKRRVVRLYTNALYAVRHSTVVGRNRTQDEAAEDVLGAAVQELAWVYRDRPGYRDEWCRVTLEKGDLVLKVDEGIEGSVFGVDGHRVQVWWEDDSVSWESVRSLKELPREG